MTIITISIVGAFYFLVTTNAETHLDELPGSRVCFSNTLNEPKQIPGGTSASSKCLVLALVCYKLSIADIDAFKKFKPGVEIIQ